MYRSSPVDPAIQSFARYLADTVAHYRFAPAAFDPAAAAVILGAWRRSERRNRQNDSAVLLLAAPPGRQHLGQLSWALREPLVQALGYRLSSWFQSLSMHIVWCGHDTLARADGIDRWVDRGFGQRWPIECFFVADFAAGRFVEARAWQNIDTFAAQDAIGRALARGLAHPFAPL